MAEVIIGLGTNLGDRLGHLRRGVRGLRALAPLRRLVASPVYESDALVPDGAPADWRLPYLNLAVRADWAETPESLLASLKGLEAELGRRDRARWAPREVDLDLLAFDDLHATTDRLKVPHPGLAERPFALLPLLDVAPDWRFPAGFAEVGGASGAEVARAWPGTPARIPFRTRRTPLSLTEIAGTLNLTPDSFSDGGRFVDPAAAIEHAAGMVAAGATVLDLGAESTRPGSTEVGAEEEWRRLAAVLPAIVAAHPDIIVSVDTRRRVTAERALAAGARWINDVTGGTDEGLVRAVVTAGADLVAMHSLSIPPRPDRTIPTDRDPIEALLEWGVERIRVLAGMGLPAGRLILDPGLGFGKSPDQAVAVLRRAGALADLGTRVLVGHSRKSFLAGWFSPDHPAATDPAARDFESALVAGYLAQRGIDYVRVHDVALARRALHAVALVG